MFYCCSFCPTLTKNEPKIIPYFPRMKEMDRVGFEPTTHATIIIIIIIAAHYGAAAAAPPSSLVSLTFEPV
jgi:hypothetical protein